MVKSIINVDNDAAPRYSSHWHLRLTDVVVANVQSFLDGLSALCASGYLTYCCVGETEDTERPHLHAALGTSRSMKQVTLTRKLGLIDKEKMKIICSNYYLSGVYKDSTVGKNLEYIKKGHRIVLEIGTPEDTNVKIRDLPFNF